jgi:hypothetical protein
VIEREGAVLDTLTRLRGRKVVLLDGAMETQLNEKGLMSWARANLDVSRASCPRFEGETPSTRGRACLRRFARD